eukprot:363911-Chlamydomonas_euryale.AAC.5
MLLFNDCLSAAQKTQHSQRRCHSERTQFGILVWSKASPDSRSQIQCIREWTQLRYVSVERSKVSLAGAQSQLLRCLRVSQKGEGSNIMFLTLGKQMPPPRHACAPPLQVHTLNVRLRQARP